MKPEDQINHLMTQIQIIEKNIEYLEKKIMNDEYNEVQEKRADKKIRLAFQTIHAIKQQIDKLK